jgi:hypothetical protein
MIDTIPVELHPHSVHWAEMARAEIARLHQAPGGVLVTVHHIGSTSIPGIMAKPIVDLIPVVSDLDSLDRNMPLVEAIGYRCFGELGLPGRRYCRRNDPVTGKRAYQLHWYAEGSPEIDRISPSPIICAATLRSPKNMKPRRFAPPHSIPAIRWTTTLPRTTGSNAQSGRRSDGGARAADRAMVGAINAG